MKPFSPLSIVIFGVLLSFANWIHAQSVFESHFLELNTLTYAPANLVKDVCPSTNVANDANTLLLKEYCASGVADAKTMANDYAENAGKYLGCMVTLMV